MNLKRYFNLPCYVCHETTLFPIKLFFALGQCNKDPLCMCGGYLCIHTNVVSEPDNYEKDKFFQPINMDSVELAEES